MTQSPGIWKQLLGVFVAALALYALMFTWIESRRVRNGPWEVTFTNPDGRLQLSVAQDSMAIRDLRISLPGLLASSNLNETIRFVAGRQVPFEIPFGACVFLDPLFLPGKVVMRLGTNEIQLMPRVLILNGVEHAWGSAAAFQLPPAAEIAR
jgi:hypothetical protein